MRGSVRKRNGRYYVIYDAPATWDDATSRWKRRQKWERVEEPNTKKHAETLLAQRLTELSTGEFRELKAIAFRDYIGVWTKTYADAQVRPATLDRYHSLFRVHLLPAFGDCLLLDLTVENVQLFRSQKLRDGQSPQSVKHMLRLLRQMLNHAIDWGYLRSNPASKVKDPRVPRREMDALGPKEVRLLLEHTPGRWFPLILTAVTTGMRLGELLAMKWQNLEWQSSRYWVKETLVRGSKERPRGFGSVKTDSSAQNVDLTPRCLAALQEHHHRQSGQKLAAIGYRDFDLIFATDKGTPLDDRNVVHRVLEPVLEDAGLRRIRFHDLRHTCATLLIAQNVPLKYVQRQLRLASMQITYDTYGHLLPEVRIESTALLDEALFGQNHGRLPVSA